MKKSISILVFLCLLTLSIKANATYPKLETLDKFVTWGFEPNHGQIRNQHGQPRPDILFSGKAHGMYFYIRNNGISYLYAPNKSKSKHYRTLESPGFTIQ